MATSSSKSGFVDSWQRGKSVTECNLHMLETEDLTDVVFLVGSEKHVVCAHRFVLASRSCVFHAMFCGRMAEQGEITIPDIEVGVFRDFLRFLYTDSCTINSENVAGLLYTSRKYDVETLYIQSASFLKESLCEENLCEVLENSHGYGETDTEQKGLKMLSKAGPKIIKSAGFLKLCFICFGTFLKSKDLSLDEEKVFEAALFWTKKECEREGLNPSHENMRKVLGELVYEIRFASLSLKFIAEVVGPSGILTGDERLTIMDSIIKTNIDISPFKSETRQKGVQTEKQPASDVHYVQRFSTIQQPSLQGPNHSISFSANKNITLLGCQLYGTDTGKMSRLDIRLYDDKDNLISYPVQYADWILSNNVNDVMFPDTVSIQAVRVYTIYIYVSNINHYSGTRGVSKTMSGGVMFTFIKNNHSGFNSFIEGGQIPGLIWK